ncbi:restriction endonuclease subunit S [Fusobacterium gonidiaformans]|uniref:restriction endonuclease subunit S n=1 Tax=Fusobacterium gonidiaformans TaxID=849 RepID=UPI001B807A77|nr:restriction endonuclease subunit S [Fusobacterium gonidiaformans]
MLFHFFSSMKTSLFIFILLNDNLEQQAQAIFKSWFVDFEPFYGKKPLAWKATTLGNVTTNIRKNIGDKVYPVFSAVNSGNLIFSDDYFTKQVYSKKLNKYIEVDTWNFAYNPARINIGSIGINEHNIIGCVSPVYVVFSVQKEYHSFFRFYFKQNFFNLHCKTKASGSVRQTLSYKDFSLIDVVYPNNEYALKFDTLWKSFYQKILRLKAENKYLSELRDSLLPKLMSGELDVSAIDL